MSIILDAQPSMRRKDANGYLHIATTPISKACVNPYLGREIAGSEQQGWNPNKIYYGLRDPKELAKAAKTFDGMPVLMNHHATNADNPAKEYTVGSIGTDGEFAYPYLKNSMTITDSKAIASIEDGTAQEISCSYRFTPDFTSGEYIAEDGSKIHYDFIMRNIEGNHVALVPQGRAGHDVRVADSNENITANERRSYMPLEFKEFIDKIMPNASAEDRALALDELNKLASDGNDEEPEDVEEDVEEEVVDKKKVKAENEDEENLDEMMKNPEFKHAFEMGAKYGEKREKAAPKRIAKEHESEGGKKAAMEADKKEKMSEDSVSAIREAVTEQIRGLNVAAKVVRPLVGEIADPFAFDSAESIYKFALEKSGVNVADYKPEAYKGMVDIMLSHKPTYPMAQDGMLEEVSSDTEKIFKCLDNID